MAFLSGIFGGSNEREIKQLEPIVARVNGLEPEFERLSVSALKEKTVEFRKRLGEGETLDDLLPEAFAAVREAAKRTLGQRHFDVQLMGGMVLHQGKIAEMRTGEGKTLVATLPAYVNALTGKGVHIVTVNDYLARRDTVWMGQIYAALGLSVGCLNHEQAYLYDAEHREQVQSSKFKVQSDKSKLKNDAARHPEPFDAAQGKLREESRDQERDVVGGFRVVHEFLRPVSRGEAYAADITYGTNNEFGFDYLRDNMAYEAAEMVQLGSRSPRLRQGYGGQVGEGGRVHHYAIVDEVDSILIDEARTPLIISAPDTESTKLYEVFSRVVPKLTVGDDYTVDEKLRAVSLTDAGISKVERLLNMRNLYDAASIQFVHHLEEALKAHALFQRDRDYVVKEGEVIIVDEFTGRLMPGRRYSGGLHQAIEAKEGVEVRKESKTLATITFQNYFRMYAKLAGMTGTAATSAEEFHKVYQLDVVSIPTHRQMIREDLPDAVYKTEDGKLRAIAADIKAAHARGQPVLVGTISIEKNERLAAMLAREGVRHEVLNAKNHEREGAIIAQAGRRGAVTVATNMAGRGVDIVLGGNPPDPAEADEVRRFGGLYVIGTERHEARRIDNQLRGRSGRQGDPGQTRFFASLEDDLMRIFGGDRVKRLMERLGVPDDQPIEHKMVSSAIEAAQARIEGYNFDLRKHVLEYDDVVNRHREVVYKKRREVLEVEKGEGGERSSLRERVREMIGDEVRRIVAAHGADGDASSWRQAELVEALRALFPLSDAAREVIESAIPDFAAVLERAVEAATAAYDSRETAVGAEVMRSVERALLLRTIDGFWMEHLEAMEHLRDSVRLRAYGQRDPLVEYKNEGRRLFGELLAVIQATFVHAIFHVQVTAQPAVARAERPRELVLAGAPKGGESGSRFVNELANQPGGESARRPTSNAPQAKQKRGRNDPCWCGSGKKYKKCHGK